MSEERQRGVIYIGTALVILSALFVITYRVNVLDEPTSAAILAISFFSVVLIILLALYPQLLNPKREIQRLDDLVVSISVFIYTVISIKLISGYGTDNMEYISEAVKNFLSGINPYVVTYHPSTVEPTYLISGQVASHFIYPPLSILIYVPIYIILNILHIQLYYLNVLNVLFQDLLTIIIYLKGRERKDPIAVLAVIFSFMTAGLLAPSFAGVNSSIWATFLALSYVYEGRKSGVFLALANSFNQISWLITPFMLIYKRTRDLKGLLFGYLITLSIINLPFLIWSPSAFLRIFTLNSDTIPVGVTGFTLINFTTLFTVEPWFFTCTIIIISAVFIYVYFRFFSILKETLWIYPLIILWFSWRTLTSYFLMWPQLVFLSVFNIDYSKTTTILQNLSLKKSVKLELMGILLAFLISITTLGYVSHVQYISENPIKIIKVEINNIKFLNSTNVYINNITILVKNLKNESVNITLVRVSVPNSLNMVWNFTGKTIPPNSTVRIIAYTTNPALYINSSVFTVEVYSNYFISSYKVTLLNGTSTTTLLQNSTSVK